MARPTRARKRPARLEDSDDEGPEGETPSPDAEQAMIEDNVEEEEEEAAEEDVPVARAKKPRKESKTQTQPKQAAKGASRGVRAEQDPDAGRARQEQQAVPMQIPPEEEAARKLKVEAYKHEYEAKHETVKLANITQQELESLAGRVIRLMLFNHNVKPGVPVKRADINEVVTSDYKEHGSMKRFAQVAVPLAQYKLIKEFGLEMKEVERTNATQKKNDDGGAKTYVLRSVLPAAMRREFMPDVCGKKGPHPGFVLVVLSILQMSGGKMKEEDLWIALSRLGCNRDDQEHDKLGKVSEALHRLEAARYVHKEKATGAADEGVVFTYEWAECAFEDIGAPAVKAYIDQEFAAQKQRALQPYGAARSQQDQEPIVLD